MDNIVKFNVDIIDKYANDESEDFSIMQIQALSDGFNSHQLKISNEVLKRDAQTVLGKPIVAKLSKDFYGKEDFKGHETDEVVIGYVPPNAEIRFPEEDNGTFFEVDAVIFKLYSGNTIDIFKRDGIKSVSCEFTYNHDDDANNVMSFVIRGITILGSDDFGNQINPSCTGANAKIIRFSETDAKNAYSKFKEQVDSMSEILKKLENIEGKIKNMSDKFENNSKEETMAKEQEKEVMEQPETEDKKEEKKEMAEPEQEEKKEEMAESKEEKDDSKEEDKKEEEEKMEEPKEEEKDEAKMKELEAELAEKEETIKAQLSELETLRQFKEKVEMSQKEEIVNDALSKAKEYIDEVKFAEFQKEAESCKFEDIENWKNKVLASITNKVLMSEHKNEDIMDMGMPEKQETKMESIFDYKPQF